MVERNSLGEREKVFGSDVCQAISQLVGRDAGGLPLALSKSQIVEELVAVVETDSDGVRQPFQKLARKAVFENINNQITNSGVFQAGYKLYEESSQHPVVPVTSYFLDRVYADNARDCFGAMNGFEIQQSLPKRVSNTHARNRDTGEIIEDDVVIGSGSIAGVAVFPPNSHAPLLRAWLHRKTNVATGLITSTVDSLAHARPESVTIERLREHAQPISTAMRQALPPPSSK